MKHAVTPTRRSSDSVQASPRHPDQLPDQLKRRNAHRPFDYGAGYGHRSTYFTGRHYADVPGRRLFNCG